MATIDEVLTKLLERTDEGRVNWKTTADERTFLAAFGNASVTIRGYTDGRPTLSILNNAGVEIETLDGDEPSGREWHQELNELYQKARRVALGVDSQLDDLMRALETGA